MDNRTHSFFIPSVGILKNHMSFMDTHKLDNRIRLQLEFERENCFLYSPFVSQSDEETGASLLLSLFQSCVFLDSAKEDL